MADYTERYVAFIDILGFREHVKSLDRDPEKLDRLLGILKEMATSYPRLGTEMGQTVGFESMFRATTFSDNIVLSGEYNAIGFNMVMTVCAALCYRLLAQGVLARGGISKGKLFHSETVVLGDGLIRSYELESKTANYPRIIIDSALVGDMHSAGVPHVWKVERDFDGLCYLDYLESASLPFFQPDSSPNPMERIRADIISTLAGAADLGVKAKMGWMARYLNARAEQLKIEPIPLG